MFQRDYIMRMIEQLSVVLARIIFNKEIQEYDKAEKEIDSACKQFLGIDSEVIKSLSDTAIIEFLKTGEKYDSEKSVIIAILLYEDAELDELQRGFNSSVLSTYIKSFSLFMESLQRNPKIVKDNYIDKIQLIIKKIIDYELPVHIRFKLFQYYEIINNYAKAEDLIIELIEIDPVFKREAVEFYERLIQKSDDDLLTGNLPREEVLEGLTSLEIFK